MSKKSAIYPTVYVSKDEFHKRSFSGKDVIDALEQDC